MNPTHILAGTLALALFAPVVPAGCAQLQTSAGTQAPAPEQPPAVLSVAVPRTSLNVAPTPSHATGIVFNDRNRNGRRDMGEPGLPNIRVSNQRVVVRTDAGGRYRLPVDDDTILFVIKPRGWMTRLDAQKLPRFYYIHKPQGSPPNTKYPGVAPTGPLPASVDFALHAQVEPNRFRAILFGDPQPRDQKEVDYIAHDVIEELVGADAAFGVSLGDIAFNNLETFPTLNQKIALIGIPWYNVIGNHDLNFESPDDKHSDETFEATYGPNYYSFDYGPTHFIVLDDVNWIGAQGGGGGRYVGGLGAQQLEWVRNDLAQIPREQMVVLMMHIPLADPANYRKPADGPGNRFHEPDRQALYRLIEKRPFCMSISGHTHFQEHTFVTRADGWQGAQPHHHLINVTVSGSWWSGVPDENGIPHTTMRDGAPNGYSFITFDGNKYTLEYKAARRPANHQMNIFAPDVINAADASKTEVLVNVFAGSQRSKVEMRLGERGPWIPMRRVAREDPYFLALKEREKSFEVGPRSPAGRKLPEVIKSPHLWQAMLPANPPHGTHSISIRASDPLWPRAYTDRRVIRIR